MAKKVFPEGMNEHSMAIVQLRIKQLAPIASTVNDGYVDITVAEVLAAMTDIAMIAEELIDAANEVTDSITEKGVVSVNL